MLEFHSVLWEVDKIVPCRSVPRSCPTLCGPVGWSTRGFPVLHSLPEYQTQTKCSVSFVFLFHVCLITFYLQISFSFFFVPMGRCPPNLNSNPGRLPDGSVPNIGLAKKFIMERPEPFGHPSTISCRVESHRSGLSQVSALGQVSSDWRIGPRCLCTTTRAIPLVVGGGICSQKKHSIFITFAHPL